MPLHSVGLVTGKLKIVLTVGILVVSCVSVPASFAYLASEKDASAPFRKTFENLKEVAKGSLNDFTAPLKQEYETILSNFKTSFGSDTINQIKEQYEVIGAAKETVSKVTEKEKLENINYYLFEFGKIIKTLFRYMPRIMMDTLAEDPEKPLEGNKLSIQKIEAIMAQQDSSKFSEALNWVISEKMDRISDLKDHEANLIMDLIGTIPYDYMNDWLKGVGENLEKVKKKQDSEFCNSGKFFMDLFIGEESIAGIGTKATNLESSLTANETALKKLLKDGGEQIIQALKQSLAKLKSMSAVPDMCNEKGVTVVKK